MQWQDGTTMDITELVSPLQAGSARMTIDDRLPSAATIGQYMKSVKPKRTL